MFDLLAKDSSRLPNLHTHEYSMARGLFPGSRLDFEVQVIGNW